MYFTEDVDKKIVRRRLGEASSAVLRVQVVRGKYRVKLVSTENDTPATWAPLHLSMLQAIADMYRGKLRQVRVDSGGHVPAKNMVEFLLYLEKRINPLLIPSLRKILGSDRPSSARRSVPSGPSMTQRKPRSKGTKTPKMQKNTKTKKPNGSNFRGQNRRRS
jgi:hypothetical protein